MKTQTPIFPTVTASIHYIGRLSLATLLIYPSPYCASAMCLGQRAGLFFFFRSKPPCSWFSGPLSQLKLVYILLSVLSLPFPSLAREFQYLRHVPWFYIFFCINYRHPLLSNRCIVPILVLPLALLSFSPSYSLVSWVY